MIFLIISSNEIKPRAYDAKTIDKSFLKRIDINNSNKVYIAKRAEHLINDGDTISMSLCRGMMPEPSTRPICGSPLEALRNADRLKHVGFQFLLSFAGVHPWLVSCTSRCPPE